MPGVSDSRWAAEGTTPGAIEAALREMLKERHAENESFSPARALNMVCVVDKAWSGEVANRLRNVGRYHASRTIVLAVEPKRTRLDAVATIASDVHPKAGEFALLRETVIVDVGEKHLPALDTIVDPLVGHRPADRAVVAARRTPRRSTSCWGWPRSSCWTRSTTRTSTTASSARASCSTKAYVVDLAWLRSTPWRERVAATFDPAHLRPDLRHISAVTVRHNPESAAAALLLIGLARVAPGLAAVEAHPAQRVADGQGPRQAPGRRSLPASPIRARASAGWPASRWRPLPVGIWSSTAVPAACAPGIATARATSASGRSSAPRAARPASSARASARRCCATRRTGRRSTRPTRWRRSSERPHAGDAPAPRIVSRCSLAFPLNPDPPRARRRARRGLLPRRPWRSTNCPRRGWIRWRSAPAPAR